jgi:hypothetical protein
MIIYNTTLSQFEVYNGAWQALAVGSGTNWFNGSGAPASTLGNNGDYYLDTATGNVYLKTSGAWGAIYSPAIAALSTTGGTMTGGLTFSGVANAINFGNGMYFNVTAGATNALQLYTRSGASEALSIVDTGSAITFNVLNATLALTGGYGITIAGTQVVGAQQAHITHDASGAANQATVNAILTALEAHGLVHN